MATLWLDALKVQRQGKASQADNKARRSALGRHRRYRSRHCAQTTKGLREQARGACLLTVALGGLTQRLKFLFDKPLLNSRYEYPSRHWELDLAGHPTDTVINARRSSALWTALPVASAKSASSQKSLELEGELSTETTAYNPSPIINDLRQELATWRSLPNASQWKVTPITQRLLEHWRAIQRDDTQTIRPFFCQLEAVEAVTCSP